MISSIIVRMRWTESVEGVKEMRINLLRITEGEALRTVEMIILK